MIDVNKKICLELFAENKREAIEFLETAKAHVDACNDFENISLKIFTSELPKNRGIKND